MYDHKNQQCFQTIMTLSDRESFSSKNHQNHLKKQFTEQVHPSEEHLSPWDQQSSYLPNGSKNKKSVAAVYQCIKQKTQTRLYLEDKGLGSSVLKKNQTLYKSSKFPLIGGSNRQTNQQPPPQYSLNKIHLGQSPISNLEQEKNQYFKATTNNINHRKTNYHYYSIEEKATDYQQGKQTPTDKDKMRAYLQDYNFVRKNKSFYSKLQHRSKNILIDRQHSTIAQGTTSGLGSEYQNKNQRTNRNRNMRSTTTRYNKYNNSIDEKNIVIRSYGNYSSLKAAGEADRSSSNVNSISMSREQKLQEHGAHQLDDQLIKKRLSNKGKNTDQKKKQLGEKYQLQPERLQQQQVTQNSTNSNKKQNFRTEQKPTDGKVIQEDTNNKQPQNQTTTATSNPIMSSIGRKSAMIKRLKKLKSKNFIESSFQKQYPQLKSSRFLSKVQLLLEYSDDHHDRTFLNTKKQRININMELSERNQTKTDQQKDPNNNNIEKKRFDQLMKSFKQRNLSLNYSKKSHQVIQIGTHHNDGSKKGVVSNLVNGKYYRAQRNKRTNISKLIAHYHNKQKSVGLGLGLPDNLDIRLQVSHRNGMQNL